MSAYIPPDALRPSQQAHISRRTFIQSGTKTAVGVAAVVWGADLRPTEAAQPGAGDKSPMLQPTPACDDAAPTLSQTAGPFYTPNTPERTSLLEPGISGTRLVVSGRVWSTNCQPLAGALLDFWQADDDGAYDNDGYRLRGHQFTDANGHYRLETIVPGSYPGRTRHIHVRVRGHHTRLLTTQLYFPGEPLNQRDGIFHPKLMVAMQEVSDGSKMAAFDFVLVS
jgi:protocatechuate 3,4-dioxygenase beta subunit